MTTKGNPLVVVSNVHREFPMGDYIVHALRGISMEVYEGEFVVVLGPSGSGKTTLLNQIGGIDSPTKGSVRIRDEELTQWDTKQLAAYRRMKVGWIFQFFNLIPSLRAWENVGLALEFQRERKNIRKRSCKLLDDVGLGDKTHRFPSQLSGGEQQRVGIARALVNDPIIILADEPTGNLDAKATNEIIELLDKINIKGTAVLMATHNDKLYKDTRRSIVRIEKGKIKSLIKGVFLGIFKGPFDSEYAIIGHDPFLNAWQYRILSKELLNLKIVPITMALINSPRNSFL